MLGVDYRRLSARSAIGSCEGRHIAVRRVPRHSDTISDGGLEGNVMRICVWVPKTRPGLLSRSFARRDRIRAGLTGSSCGPLLLWSCPLGVRSPRASRSTRASAGNVDGPWRGSKPSAAPVRRAASSSDSSRSAAATFDSSWATLLAPGIATTLGRRMTHANVTCADVASCSFATHCARRCLRSVRRASRNSRSERYGGDAPVA